MRKEKRDANSPPFLAEFILKRFFPDDGNYTTLGDLYEVYNYIKKDSGSTKAKIWYWGQLLTSALPIIQNNFLVGGAMFKKHFLIAWRNLLKYKGYSFINIAGLAVGMACSILIYIWVANELSTNMFHEKLDDIYWLNTINIYGSERETGWGTNPAAGPFLAQTYPEVVSAYRHQNGTVEMIFNYKDKKLKEDVKFGDLSLFEIFTFPIVKGDIPNDYHERQVLALNQSTAEKYFGTENPIGKSILVNGEYEFEVVVVYEDMPENSNIKFNVYANLEFLETLYRKEQYTRTWYNCSFQTFLLMQPNTDVEAFNSKIQHEIQIHNPDNEDELYIMPFKDYYLYVYKAIDEIKLFGLIAVFILLIACINFMNLSTARASKRAKEVGLRKVVGARRKEMIAQFFSEAILTTLLAGLISIITIYILLPFFNDLAGSNFSPDILYSANVLLGILGITVFTGIVSGIYPALILSSFQPVKVLQGSATTGTKGKTFRNILVIIQFSFSIFLIIAASVASNQQQHILNKNLGFEKDQIVQLRLKGDLLGKVKVVKEELSKTPGVITTTLTSSPLTGIYNNGSGWNWEGKDENLDPFVTYFSVDEDFEDTYHTQMVQGEFFQPDRNYERSVIINEAFVNKGNIKDPIGKKLLNWGMEFTIVGVIKDFNYKPAYRPIEPLMIFKGDWPEAQYLSIKIAPENLESTLPKLEEAYSSFSPEFPFEYTFLDDDFAALYNDMKVESDIFKTFTLLAIIISCLGLFGLASYMAEKRTKEIGIRKVMGAGIGDVILLLSKSFTKLILISIIIASPIAYYFTQNWLEDYPYRISLSPVYFIIAGVITLVIALTTISYVTQKAARKNPVESIKYE